MFGLYSVEIIVLISLIIAWFAYDIKVKRNQAIIIAISFVILLIIIETFRDGSINRDYDIYIQYILYPQSNYLEVESSFFHIVKISNFLAGNYLVIFFIYAVLGISLKMLAIYKYSINVLYSTCVWLSFSYILHDLIQIRAAVAGALFLFMIPAVCQKKYIKAIIFWIIAIYFHNSAIIFGLIFILKKDIINPKIWIFGYIILFCINILNLPIYTIIVSFISYLPGSLAYRIGSFDPTILNNITRMSMYSRYILIPSIFCLSSLFFIDRLKQYSNYSILCLKICFCGIYIYGLSIPIVSERLFEILILPFIYLVPSALFWFKTNSNLKGRIIITIFCLFMSWNLLFKQAVFS